jgi:UDP-N-acetylglucosamine--N-acetylmuramyl-(pentapeptide) pyrophosphoryl-undecaprenol N-acetylglucosamine transferase
VRIVVTGGGSGGHIYPALAVVEGLRGLDPNLDPVFVGGTQGMEAQVVSPTGIRFVGVTTRKLRKLASPSTIGVLLALAKGYGEASRFLREFRPQAVVSTGGYVAAATAIAAARRRIPVVILAPDAVPGRTNLLVSRRATRICIMFEEARAAFPADKTVLTGLPIRTGIVSKQSQACARESLGLDPGQFTILATGGSQGAQRLNGIVQATVSMLPPGIQLLHQVGAKNMAAAEERPGYIAVPYLDADQIPRAYRAADVTICRCGVGSLAEAAANGLPMLMVPLPTAYADHQTHNARAMERGGAGILLPQPDLTPEKLVSAITELHADPPRLARMSAASRSLGRPDAAERVARIAFEICT